MLIDFRIITNKTPTACSEAFYTLLAHGPSRTHSPQNTANSPFPDFFCSQTPSFGAQVPASDRFSDEFVLTVDFSITYLGGLGFSESGIGAIFS